MFPTGGVTSLLPLMIELVKTKELMLLGEQFSAPEALELGITWKVIANDSVFKIAQDTAERITVILGNAVKGLTRVLHQVAVSNIERAMNLETEATVRGFWAPENIHRVAKF